jgi:hypothetical protein
MYQSPDGRLLGAWNCSISIKRGPFHHPSCQPSDSLCDTCNFYLLMNMKPLKEMLSWPASAVCDVMTCCPKLCKPLPRIRRCHWNLWSRPSTLQPNKVLGTDLLYWQEDSRRMIVCVDTIILIQACLQTLLRLAFCQGNKISMVK